MICLASVVLVVGRLIDYRRGWARRGQVVEQELLRRTRTSANSGSSVGTNSSNRQPRGELRGRGEAHNAPREQTNRALPNHRKAVSIINQAHMGGASSG